jgi:hypothetical protein
MASIPLSAAIPIANHSDSHHPQAIEALKTLDERNGGVSTVIGCWLVCPFGLWICGLVLSSDRPALFVGREYNAFGEFAKAGREIAAPRATNSERVSSIHLDTQMTMLIYGGSCQRMLTYRHFPASMESVGVPMGTSPPKARWQRSSLQE